MAAPQTAAMEVVEHATPGNTRGYYESLQGASESVGASVDPLMSLVLPEQGKILTAFFGRFEVVSRRFSDQCRAKIT